MPPAGGPRWDEKSTKSSKHQRPKGPPGGIPTPGLLGRYIVSRQGVNSVCRARVVDPVQGWRGEPVPGQVVSILRQPQPMGVLSKIQEHLLEDR